jgi:hypothetical protein
VFFAAVSKPAMKGKKFIGGFDTPFAIAQGYSTTSIRI